MFTTAYDIYYQKYSDKMNLLRAYAHIRSLEYAIESCIKHSDYKGERALRKLRKSYHEVLKELEQKSGFHECFSCKRLIKLDQVACRFHSDIY